MRVITLLLFVMGVFSVWTTLGQTPAFNPSVRAETLMGGWRIPATDAMYDPGAYAFQRGYAFLMADMSISADTETRDEIASANVAEMRARQAISALNTAVSLDPANAHAWAQLAWAKARVAEDKEALHALRISWRLAPYNRVLADTRVNLVGLLTDPAFQVVSLSATDREAISMEAETLSRFDKPSFTYYRESFPYLSELNTGNSKG